MPPLLWHYYIMHLPADYVFCPALDYRLFLSMYCPVLLPRALASAVLAFAISEVLKKLLKCLGFCDIYWQDKRVSRV